MTTLLSTLGTLYKRISRAALKANRNPMDVTLIAVTKTVGVEAIREAVDAGIRVFGENRVQEARDKIEYLRNIPEEIRWHMVGHLQRNKAKYAVPLFDLIHSVDSAALAVDINNHADRIDKIQDILVEVKLSPEEAKHGISKEELGELLNTITAMKNLNLRGLMTIPPYSDNPGDARPYFKKLRTLRDELEGRGFHLPELSMGMSHDFEIAIEEGATIVRIGTAIFGERR